MAIPFVTIELDKPRRLRFGMGAMIEMEQLTGIKIVEMDETAITGETCAKILWIMLKQDDDALTLKDTCHLIDEYGSSLTEVIEKVAEAIRIAFAVKPKNAGPTAKR